MYIVIKANNMSILKKKTNENVNIILYIILSSKIVTRQYSKYIISNVQRLVHKLGYLYYYVNIYRFNKCMCLKYIYNMHIYT